MPWIFWQLTFTFRSVVTDLGSIQSAQGVTTCLSLSHHSLMSVLLFCLHIRLLHAHVLKTDRGTIENPGRAMGVHIHVLPSPSFWPSLSSKLRKGCSTTSLSTSPVYQSCPCSQTSLMSPNNTVRPVGISSRGAEKRRLSEKTHIKKINVLEVSVFKAG